MAIIKRLPDSEFEVMEIIWDNSPPLTTLQIMQKMPASRSLKLQTLLTMLMRLTEKGFLISERVGRERNYSPVISKQDYVKAETESFKERHYISSLGSLIKAFYDDRELSPQDIKELQDWLAERGRSE